MQICIEEIVYMLIDAIKEDTIDIDVRISLPEIDRTCGMTFTYRGECFNPFERYKQNAEDALYDHLGLLIIDRKAEHFTHRYENGVNIISLDL